jgi:hypothetical protein
MNQIPFTAISSVSSSLFHHIMVGAAFHAVIIPPKALTAAMPATG